MSKKAHPCQCPRCCSGKYPEEQESHHRLNLVLSRLEEHQRRWLAAYEALRLGNILLVSQITGLDRKTIRRGVRELQSNLETCPPGQTRLCKKAAGEAKPITPPDGELVLSTTPPHPGEVMLQPTSGP